MEPIALPSLLMQFVNNSDYYYAKPIMHKMSLKFLQYNPKTLL